MYWLYWVLLAYYVLWEILLIRCINTGFDVYLQAYKNLPAEVKKKYFMYIRVEHDKLNKTPFILAALTTGFLKA